MKIDFQTLLVILFCTTLSLGQIPQQINYQGMLSNASGNPITKTYNVNFAIYNDVASSSAIWTETQTINVSHGVFNAQLGSSNPIPIYIFDGGDKYPGVQFGSDPEMSPRQKLNSIDYSFKAADAITLNDLPSSGFSAADYNHNSLYPHRDELYENDGTINQSTDLVNWNKLKDVSNKII